MPLQQCNTSYPKSIFLILLTPFQSIFLYSSFQNILILYLTQELFYNENTATSIFHAFSMAVFSFNFLVAIMADTVMGKFRAIIYMLTFSLFGCIIITSASVPNFLPMRSFSMVALVLIAIGIGGIKSCGLTFGGDQFESNQKTELRRFFSYFLISIKLGMLLSMLVTPIFRAKIHCFGELTCYPLAYGFNAILTALTLVFFLIGYSTYKINPPSSSVLFNEMKCITHALVRKIKLKNVTRKNHWLDYADDKFDPKIISDLKRLFRTLLIFSTLPIINALVNLKGSSFILQATKLENTVLGFTIEPDQMQMLLAIFGIISIPAFEYIVYPLFNKCHILTRPLQRLILTCFLISLSCFAAGYLQLSLEEKLSNCDTKSSLNFQNNISSGIHVEIHPLSSLTNNYQFNGKTNEDNIALHLNLTTLNSTEDKEKINILFSNNNSLETNMIFYSHGNIPITQKLENNVIRCDTFSILLQIPQYILLGAGETIFLIVIMDFAYSQAPASMKTIVESCVLFTSAIGNLLVIIIQQLNFLDKESYKLFFYFGLALLDILVLIILAYNYKYKEDTET